MITGFLFDDMEAAYYIGGAANAVMRRVPKHGYVECKVKPLRKDGKQYKRANQLAITIRIYAGINGRSPYVLTGVDTMLQRSLCASLRRDGIAVEIL